MASADAQAFKRACSCFGLGRHFYDFPAIWVDLDQNRQPVNTPALSAWALPENWRKGMRPRARKSDGRPRAEVQSKGRKETMVVRKRQLVGVMEITGRGVTVQLKSLMAHL